ncbi:MAG: hypothetical protein ACT4PG_05550 [Panacagrimonas sp.]
MSRFRYAPFVIAALGLSSLDSHAASLSALYSRVPAPPADVATALRWWRDGQIVAPEYQSFVRELEAERAATAALAGGDLPPITIAANLDNTETAEVRQAASAYNAYLTEFADKKEPSAALAKRTRWLQAAMGGNLQKVMAQGSDADAAAKKARLAQQDISQWNTLFADWTRGRAAIVNKAETQIAATRDGAVAVSPAGRVAIAKFRAAMLKEIEVALSVTELAVKRAWAIESGQPDAVSSPTRNYKPPQ